jgi:hypothetical protein
LWFGAPAVAYYARCLRSAVSTWHCIPFSSLLIEVRRHLVKLFMNIPNNASWTALVVVRILL